MADLIKQSLYLLIQATWGLPQTLAGLVVFLVCARRPHTRHCCAIVTTWNLKSGLSLGPFVFMPNYLEGATPADRTWREKLWRRLLAHEYGHTLQSLLFGPLYLPVFAIPSFVWAGLPALRRRRERTGRSYYDFYTERFANQLARRVTGEETPTR